jgi:hypothetical protein
MNAIEKELPTECYATIIVVILRLMLNSSRVFIQLLLLMDTHVPLLNQR